MFRTNRSCPGTSTNPTSRPEGRVHQANPRSIVSPRRFSSASRSGSMPVRRTSRLDFPWSTCPAVATTWSAGSFAPGVRSVILEVAALARVLDCPTKVRELRLRYGSQVEQHGVILHTAEHRRAPRPEAGRRCLRVRNPKPDGPGGNGVAGKRSSPHRRVGPHDERVGALAVELFGQARGAMVDL